MCVRITIKAIQVCVLFLGRITPKGRIFDKTLIFKNGIVAAQKCRAMRAYFRDMQTSCKMSRNRQSRKNNLFGKGVKWNELKNAVLFLDEYKYISSSNE